MLLIAACWLLVVVVPRVLSADLADAATSTTLAGITTPVPVAPWAGRASRVAPTSIDPNPAAPERRLAIPADVAPGRWVVDMSSQQQVAFRAAIASAPELVRELTKGFDARTHVQVLERTQCGELHSCAIGIVTDQDGVRTASYSLEFLPEDLDGSGAARFLVLHEIGHLVDYEGITEEDAARFTTAFRASPAWKDCFPHDGECLASDELFADQFAIYATGAATSLTTYATPRLLSDATFEALLRATYLR